MDKKIKTMLGAGAVLGLVAVYLNLDQSTKRFLVHIGKQVPYLPYRYFI